jgi:fibronectin-binding autotransporter adhesin
MSNIGAAAQYQGFGVFQKTGSSTWTLTGTAGTATSWTVTGGLLNFSSTSAFNGGTLTLNGGGLQWASGTSTDISSSLAALGAGGATFDTNGNNVTFGTGLSGTGALTKSGSGTLTLSIANTYSGGTDVEAGTLQLSGPGTLGSSSGSVTVSGGTLDLGGTSQIVGALSGSGGAIALGSGALTVNQSTSTSYAGAISGTGSLTKSGTGTLILDGVNTYTGGTTVTAGALEIGDASTPGASLAGAVTVGASGTLMGHGAIGGNVMNIAGGIVSPGGTIGTLTVSGNYTQGASSTLSIEASPTAASKLLVGGSASLAGTLALVYDPGVYTGKSFTILSAGSIAGTFSTITSNAASIVQTLAYGPTSVDLSSFGSFAIAPTADTAFTALGTAALEGAQQSNSLLLGHLANPQSGGNIESGAASPPATQATQLAFNGGAEQLSQVVAALPAAMSQLGGWFRGLGEFDHLSGSASMPGFTTQAGGFLAGIDRPVADHLIAGIAAGYGHTDLSQGDGERGKIDTPRLALYGSDDLGAWALDGTIGYGYDRIAATRAIAALGATAISNHDGHEANAALQARTRLIAGGIAVTPAAGLQYTHLFETAFTESGASGFDLSVAKRNSDSLRPFLGVSAEESFTTANGTMLTPEADLAYSHELFNTPPSLVAVGGGSFSVDGLTPSRDALTLGGSVSAAMNDRLDLYAAYHATLPTGNLLAQTVEAGVTYKF